MSMLLENNVKKYKKICQQLVIWYATHARTHLPWRNLPADEAGMHNPYHILVSEVMLQQTQVERVIPKYKEFLRAFPSVQSLAKAKTADVITAWKGLGYNRRALFLQRTAQTVVEKFAGKFPRDLETLKTLPGVGDYTARALLSFAFQEPVAMMDTNHRRFYQRVFFGLRKKDDRTLLKKAEEIISVLDPSTTLRFAQGDTSYHWNQALMDFGSMVCLTKRPKCEECPLQKYCKAYPGVIKALKHKNIKAVKANGKDAGLKFEETDRYFRGRIIDILREKKRVEIKSLQSRFKELPNERLEKIFLQLEKDGLIKRERKSILLP